MNYQEAPDIFKPTSIYRITIEIENNFAFTFDGLLDMDGLIRYCTTNWKMYSIRQITFFSSQGVKGALHTMLCG